MYSVNFPHFYPLTVANVSNIVIPHLRVVVVVVVVVVCYCFKKIIVTILSGLAWRYSNSQ